MALIARTIRLEHSADGFYKKHRKDPAFDRQWMAITWLLARTPEIGKRYFNSPCLLYGIPGIKDAGTKTIWVLYTYDEQLVYIHDVRFRDEKDISHV